jgi:ectoine hydroxylase-related dioxygenase (phytanoyl-CoA dioxygenase family)
MELPPADLTKFRRDGWLVLPRVISNTELAAIDRAVDAVAHWASHGGPGLHHFEATDWGPVLARSEDFVPHSDVLAGLAFDVRIRSVLGQLFGETPALFKEKINYKHPGGGGFAPHQDAAAYRFADYHISVMIPIDSSTQANGCLHVASNLPGASILPNYRGRIDPAIVAGLEWRPLELEPGDLLFFHSYLPHRSEANTTRLPRRTGYLTYNAASAGEFRKRYYIDKKAEFDLEGGDFSGQRVRMSISDDFLGRPVNKDGSCLASRSSTHEREGDFGG